jgi:hypothetical protein
MSHEELDAFAEKVKASKATALEKIEIMESAQAWVFAELDDFAKNLKASDRGFFARIFGGAR